MNDRFETSFASYFAATHAFAFWKGRVALYAILRGLGVGPDAEVIVPGYTCVMDVNPVKYLGAKPVYVDIEPITYNMNVELLEMTACSLIQALSTGQKIKTLSREEVRNLDTVAQKRDCPMFGAPGVHKSLVDLYFQD